MTDQQRARITDGINTFVNPIALTCIGLVLLYLAKLTVATNESMIRMEERMTFMQTTVTDLSLRVARLEATTALQAAPRN
jgi:hypothetical protein